jgi:hypothetical protein
MRIAKEANATHLLFIDSDMEFSEDLYDRLRRIDADIACALFWSRQTPSYPTICKQEKAEDGVQDRLRTITPDGTIQDIDVCGMAATLINKRIIQAFDYPAFVHTGWMSEDFVFCLMAKQKFGARIKCDTSLKVAHRGDIGFNGQTATLVEGSTDLSFPLGVTGEKDTWRITK